MHPQKYQINIRVT